MDDLVVPTVGVEEEFLLLGADGSPACVAADVLAALADDPHVKPEFMSFQVESNSGVCTTLGGLADDLLRERRALARAAGGHGARLVSAGTPPFAVPPSAVTDRPRYRRLQELFPSVAEDAASCGCHVHVAVPSPDLGMAVIRRVRGWLPVLLALAANSPLWRGRDSGWDSYRFVVQSRWPTTRVPPACADAAAYQALVSRQIADGAALDPSSVYYLARLSPKYPTVEIRVADAGLTLADTVLVAALCRALVATALAESLAMRPGVRLPGPVVSAATRTAARRGLDARLVDPCDGRPAPGRKVLERLVRHVAPALDAADDRRVVTTLLAWRLRHGSGAARQRALLRDAGPGGLVGALADATVAVP